MTSSLAFFVIKDVGLKLKSLVGVPHVCGRLWTRVSKVLTTQQGPIEAHMRLYQNSKETTYIYIFIYKYTPI